MLKNDIVTALRNLIRQKVFTPLNVIGLSFGLACFVMIYMFINFELSYDTYHEKYDRIYKVIKQDPGNFYMGTNIFRVTPVPLAETLTKEYPEVETATKLSSSRTFLVRVNDETYYNSGWYYADKNVFDVFTFPLIHGDPATALEQPYTAVLNETYADKYFGNENPIGKTIEVIGGEDFTITGVMRNIPDNSHFIPNFFISFESMREERNFTNWGSNSYHTYFVMTEGGDYKQLEAKLPAMIDKYAGDNIWSHRGEKTKYIIEKLGDIHLRSLGIFGISGHSDIKYIYMFAAIAFIILLIACVNYMNLATVQSIRRGREVGIRKVVGAFRHQLIRQFIGESILLTFISFILSLGLVYLLMPLFANLVQREIPYSTIANMNFLLPVAAVVLLVGLAAGWYPALMASAFKPVLMLKGSFSKSSKGLFLRNSMVVLQFSISICLIISTLVVTEQLSYVRNKKLGYNRDHVIALRMRGNDMVQNKEAVKQEIQNLASVKAVSFGNHSPVRLSSSSMAHFEGRAEDQDKMITYRTTVDKNFLDLFEIELVAGRNFIRDSGPEESPEYIINETAAKKLGWDNPIGKEFGFGKNIGTVIGVMKDFHFTSLHLPIMPLSFSCRDSYRNRLFVKISSENTQNTMEEIETIWNKFSAGYPFNYRFLDDAYDSMYRSETRLGKIFTYFAALAIIICSLGLFGLASFTAQQSVKEIGIRKVLGAAERDIVGMLSWKFTKWVIAANIIAWPTGYYAMSIWLDNFEYRISPGIGIFILAGVSALIIAGLTVSIQTLRAARSNPVKALRYE